IRMALTATVTATTRRAHFGRYIPSTASYNRSCIVPTYGHHDGGPMGLFFHKTAPRLASDAVTTDDDTGGPDMEDVAQAFGPLLAHAAKRPAISDDDHVAQVVNEMLERGTLDLAARQAKKRTSQTKVQANSAKEAKAAEEGKPKWLTIGAAMVFLVIVFGLAY